MVLAPGLGDWLAEAAEVGLRTAVASSSDVAWVERHLRQVGAYDCFETIVGGDQAGAHKPAPDVYHLTLSALELEGADAVAVEDTAHGIDAAHAAGIPCIAIPNPFVSQSAVAHAELVLGCAAELSLVETLRRVSGRP